MLCLAMRKKAGRGGDVQRLGGRGVCVTCPGDLGLGRLDPESMSLGGWGAVVGSEGSINSGWRRGRGRSAWKEQRRSLPSLFITSGLSNAGLLGRSDKIKREWKKCQLQPE